MSCEGSPLFSYRNKDIHVRKQNRRDSPYFLYFMPPANSLFRAFSTFRYGCDAYAPKVKRECVNFLKICAKEFVEEVEAEFGFQCTEADLVRKCSDWERDPNGIVTGITPLDFLVLSYIYEIRIVVHIDERGLDSGLVYEMRSHEGKLQEDGCGETALRLSRTHRDGHVDLLIPKIKGNGAVLNITQSIVYEQLVKVVLDCEGEVLDPGTDIVGECNQVVVKLQDFARDQDYKRMYYEQLEKESKFPLKICQSVSPYVFRSVECDVFRFIKSCLERDLPDERGLCVGQYARFSERNIVEYLEKEENSGGFGDINDEDPSSARFVVGVIQSLPNCGNKDSNPAEVLLMRSGNSVRVKVMVNDLTPLPRNEMPPELFDGSRIDEDPNNVRPHQLLSGIEHHYHHQNNNRNQNNYTRSHSGPAVRQHRASNNYRSAPMNDESFGGGFPPNPPFNNYGGINAGRNSWSGSGNPRGHHGPPGGNGRGPHSNRFPSHINSGNAAIFNHPFQHHQQMHYPADENNSNDRFRHNSKPGLVSNAFFPPVNDQHALQHGLRDMSLRNASPAMGLLETPRDFRQRINGDADFPPLGPSSSNNRGFQMVQQPHQQSVWMDETKQQQQQQQIHAENPSGQTGSAGDGISGQDLLLMMGGGGNDREQQQQQGRPPGMGGCAATAGDEMQQQVHQQTPNASPSPAATQQQQDGSPGNISMTGYFSEVPSGPGFPHQQARLPVPHFYPAAALYQPYLPPALGGPGGFDANPQPGLDAIPAGYTPVSTLLTLLQQQSAAAALYFHSQQQHPHATSPHQTQAFHPSPFIWYPSPASAAGALFFRGLVGPNGVQPLHQQQQQQGSRDE